MTQAADVTSGTVQIIISTEFVPEIIDEADPWWDYFSFCPRRSSRARIKLVLGR